MIEKRLIIKSINDAISKCSSNGGNSQLNNNIRKSFHNFFKKTCGDKPLKHEKGMIVDKNGDILWETNKNQEHKSFINLDINKFQELRIKYGRLNLDHNHPLVTNHIEEPYYPNMLSATDMENMDYMAYDDSLPNGMDYIFKSMTAESSNGSRVTMLRKETFDRRNDASNYTIACEHLTSYYNETVDKFINQMYKDVNHEIYLFKQNNNRDPTNEEKIKIKNNIGWDYYNEYTNGLKPIQKEFNDCNMELIVEIVK